MKTNRSIEDRGIIAEGISAIELKHANQDSLTEVTTSEEEITIREREKRIAVERIKNEIDLAREKRRLNELELHDMVRAEREKRRLEEARLLEEQQKAENVLVEEPVTITPAYVPGKKRSKARTFFVRLFTYAGSIALFFVVMSYLFWRFAPANDVYKNEFVVWMSDNATKGTNNFVFNTLGLKQYYTAPKIVDYSGDYENAADVDAGRIYITHNGMNLKGHYTINEKEYSLKGYIDNKGEFLLLETYDGLPTAMIKGTFFTTGYLTAERYEQKSGKKDIISMQKIID